MREAHLTLHARRHPLRLADALRVAALERDRPLAHGCLVHVRLELLDEGPALGEGLAQPLQEVGLSVVVLRKRAKADDCLLADHQPPVAALHPLQRDEADVFVVSGFLFFYMKRHVLTLD